MEVFHGIRQRTFAGSEQPKQRLHENIAGDNSQGLCEEGQEDGIGQCVFGLLYVFSPQQDRDPHGRTGPYQHTEGHQEDQDWEGDSQARQGIFAHPVPDEDTVYDVV